MLAYDYPLLGVIWTTVVFMLWIMWFVILFRVVADVFRSKDLGGFAKTLWLLFVLFLPFLGVFVYVIARGDSMTQRTIEQAVTSQKQFDSYIRETAGTSSSAADELEKLASLRDKGVLTDAEFEAKKAQLLA